MSVNVVIIPDSTVKLTSTDTVRSYFTNELFNIKSVPDYRLEDGLPEVSLFKAILETYGSQHTIIVKESSVSNLTSDQIADVVRKALEMKVDLYYLARWEDQCQMSARLDNTFLRTYSPHGYQAVMFYPSSVGKILKNLKLNETIDVTLNYLIYNGVIMAIANQINIMNYDAFGIGNSNSLFNRLNMCSLIIKTPTASNINKYLYIGGILLLIFLVAWAMRKIGPKKQETTTQKPDDLLKNLAI